MMTLIRNPLLVLIAIALGTSGCSKEAKKTKFIERAHQNFKAGQFEKAEIDYLNALRIAPESTVIRQLGVIYHQEGRWREAFVFLQKAKELDPENADIHRMLAMLNLAFGKTDEARLHANKVLSKIPGDEEALLLLAESAAGPQKIQETRQQIEQLRAQDRDRVGYHLALGTLFLRQNEVDQAERQFNSALKLEPSSGSVHLALGNVYWGRNNLDKAAASFRIAAQNAPIRSVRRLKFAEFQLKTGKIEDAKKTLEEITVKAPGYIPAWTSLFRVAFASQEFENCSALVAKVLARDRDNFDALLYAGLLKIVKQDAPGAITHFEQMSSLYGKSPDVQFQLGRAQLMNGDATKALRSLDRALTIDPNSTDALLLRCELKLQQGDAASVIDPLKQVVKTKPQIAQAHLLLANAYLTQKRADEAVRVYSNMATFFPQDPRPALFRGAAFMQEGKRDQARQSFEQSLQLYPAFFPAIEALVDLDLMEKNHDRASTRVQKQMEANPKAVEPLLLQAKIQIAQKNTTGAEASLQKCIALNPDHRVAYLILSQLYVETKRDQEALNNLEALLQKTNDITAMMQIGVINDNLKSFPAARDAYEKILSFNPKFTPALNNLAYLYCEHLNKVEAAYELAQKARQLMPGEPFTADTLGWVCFKRADYSRALSLLQESASKLPGQGEVQYHLGMTYYMLGDEPPARAALDKAFRSNDNFAAKNEIKDRLTLLDLDELRLGTSDLEFLEKCIRQQPDDAIALSRLAAIYERTGQIQKAVEVCETAIKKNPSNARFLLKLSRLYSNHLKDQSKALALAKQARSAAPHDPYISHMLGRLAYQAGDFTWASSLIQEASQQLAPTPELNFDLALCFYSMGQVSLAESNLKTALQQGGSFQGSEDAKLLLSMIEWYANPMLARGTTARIDQVLQLNPNYIPALMASAATFLHEGKFSSARDSFEKVLVLNPLFTPVYRDLARLYARTQLKDAKAYSVTVKAREAFPQDEEIAKILGILAYGKNDYSRAAQLLGEVARKRGNDGELFYYLGMAKYKLKKVAEYQQPLKHALTLNIQGELAAEAKKVLSER